MPFELGLAVAWVNCMDRRHNWYVLETRNYRVAKSLATWTVLKSMFMEVLPKVF